MNNAGVVAPIGPTAKGRVREWAAAIAVNLIGVVDLTVTLLPNMLDQAWGRIADASSGGAARAGGMIGGSAYVTSKAALEAHVVNLAAELAGTGCWIACCRQYGNCEQVLLAHQQDLLNKLFLPDTGKEARCPEASQTRRSCSTPPWRR